MRNRVERLRLWLLGCAGFLSLVIVAFLGSAHYLSRHRLSLPTRMGLNIVSETNVFSKCQTVQGRTEFCIHAGKAVEHSDGKITLHDVSIDLYGKNGDRNDHINGDEFEYDQKAEVFRAIGLVNLDLLAAQAGGGNVSTDRVAKVLHVTTSKLVYLRKLGVAATSEEIDFQTGTITGHATGADYNSDTGVLVMHSSVSMSGAAGNRPVDVTAATAEIDNHNHEIFLTGARGVSLGQTVEAQRATLHTRPDGTLTQVEAQGNVTREGRGSRLISQHADVMLNAKSHPQSAVLTGGVQYSYDEPLLQRSGQAKEATIAFDAQGQAKQAVFSGSVHMSERTRATEVAKEPWSSRDLTAERVKTVLVPAVGGSAQVRDVEATGSARLTAENHGTLAISKDHGREEMSADVLTAHLTVGSDGRQPPQFDTVAGHGHTLLHQVTVDGTDQTSSADTLAAKFRTQPAIRGLAGRQTSLFALGGETDMLQSAAQQGHVTMMRRVPAKSGSKSAMKEDVERAAAERATYDGDQDRMILTGSVQLMDAGSVLWANQVTLDHKTGDSQAVGSVKVDYVRDNAAPNGTAGEPTHIFADRVEIDHANDVATFHGKPARLWQGASQVQAPVIELARDQKRLIARGEASTGWSTVQQAAQVRTVLSREADRGDTGKPGSAVPGCANTTAKSGAGSAGAAAQSANVVRIASGGLVFSGNLSQADFTGGFRADSADGTIRANEGAAYLQQGGVPAISGMTVPSLTGRLQRVLAVGHVDIQQPGFHATGERLLYTASDQVFLLTGEGTSPPQITDARGTTTAAALRLHSSCDDSRGVSVEALSAVSGEPAQRVQTETRVGNDEKKEKRKR